MDTPTPPDGRLTAFGNQLIDMHTWLREELAALRASLDAGRTGRSRDLRAHCLAFCAALTRHHTGEDETAFPLLAERHPGLRPVLEELRRDHDIVTGILRAIEDLLAGLGSNPAPEEVRRVRGELDGLSALLDSHFLYEEKRIVQALNELDPPGWREGRPAFLRPGY